MASVYDYSKYYWKRVVANIFSCGDSKTSSSEIDRFEFDYQNRKWEMQIVSGDTLETSRIHIPSQARNHIVKVPILMILSDPKNASISCATEGFLDHMTVFLAEYAKLTSKRSRPSEMLVHLYTKVTMTELFPGHNSLLHGLWCLYKNKSPTLDVTFQAKDGRVGAHSILLVRTPRQFEDQHQKSTERAPATNYLGEIAIPDFDLHIVTHFVEYLYTRHLPIDVVQNFPMEMWVLGERFGIWTLTRDLRDLCAFFITEKNVVDLFVKSTALDADSIKESCLNMMDMHIGRVDKVEMVTNLPKDKLLWLLKEHHPL